MATKSQPICWPSKKLADNFCGVRFSICLWMKATVDKGSDVMRAAIESAKTRGWDRASVTVSPKNHIAAKLYEDIGFRARSVEMELDLKA